MFQTQDRQLRYVFSTSRSEAMKASKKVSEGLRRCFKVEKFSMEGGVCHSCLVTGRDWGMSGAQVYFGMLNMHLSHLS